MENKKKIKNLTAIGFQKFLAPAALVIKELTPDTKVLLPKYGYFPIRITSYNVCYTKLLREKN